MYRIDITNYRDVKNHLAFNIFYDFYCRSRKIRFVMP